MIHYMHSIPGRLRVKIPAIKGNPEKARAIQALLSGVEGLESIRANTITGSIVVKYEQGRFLRERILTVLKKQGGLHEHSGSMTNVSAFEPATKAGQALGKAFCGWAVGRALEGTGFSFW